jgi:hypothetical protein
MRPKTFLKRFKTQHIVSIWINREEKEKRKEGQAGIWPGRARSGLDPAQLASLPGREDRRTGTRPRPFDQAAIDGRGASFPSPGARTQGARPELGFHGGGAYRGCRGQSWAGTGRVEVEEDRCGRRTCMQTLGISRELRRGLVRLWWWRRWLHLLPARERGQGEI